MTESDVNVISHLLEVEQNAQTMISDATAESSRRIIEAKSKAEEEFNLKYSQMINEMEDSFNAEINSYRAKHEQELEQYKVQITSAQRDTQAFDKLVTSIIG